MRAFVKFLLTAVGLVLISIGVVVIVLGLQAEKALKAGMERTLTHVFQAPVTIEDVNLSLADPAVHIKGIELANPDGFREDHALRFEVVEVRFNAASLLSRAPEITEVKLLGGHVNLRHELGEGTNLQCLIASARRLPQHASVTGPQGAKRAFRIDSLFCDGAKIDLSADMVPGGKLPINVPPFSLSDVDGENPMTTAEIGVLTIRTLMKQAVSLQGVLRPVAEMLEQELGPEPEEGGAHSAS